MSNAKARHRRRRRERKSGVRAAFRKRWVQEYLEKSYRGCRSVFLLAMRPRPMLRLVGVL